MFRKILQKLKSLSRNSETFDPADIGDPLALETDWTPAKRGGANFRTHKLVWDAT